MEERRPLENDSRRADGGVFTLEAVLSCLTSPRRRSLLYYLQEHETATVDELARQMVARETEQPPEDVPPEQYERALLMLHHHHLPALADALFVDYDPRSKTVRYSNPPAALDAFLRLAAEIEDDSDSSKIADDGNSSE